VVRQAEEGRAALGRGCSLAQAFTTALDADKDGAVTQAEFTQGFLKWFDSVEHGSHSALTEEQLRAGINQDLSPFRGGPPPGFDFARRPMASARRMTLTISENSLLHYQSMQIEQTLHELFWNPTDLASLPSLVLRLIIAAVLGILLGQAYVHFGQSLSNRKLFARNSSCSP